MGMFFWVAVQSPVVSKISLCAFFMCQSFLHPTRHKDHSMLHTFNSLSVLNFVGYYTVTPITCENLNISLFIRLVGLLATQEHHRQQQKTDNINDSNNHYVATTFHQDVQHIL